MLTEGPEYVENGIIERVQLRAACLFIADATADAVECSEVERDEQNRC